MRSPTRCARALAACSTACMSGGRASFGTSSAYRCRGVVIAERVSAASAGDVVASAADEDACEPALRHCMRLLRAPHDFADAGGCWYRRYRSHRRGRPPHRAAGRARPRLPAAIPFRPLRPPAIVVTRRSHGQCGGSHGFRCRRSTGCRRGRLPSLRCIEHRREPGPPSPLQPRAPVPAIVRMVPAAGVFDRAQAAALALEDIDRAVGGDLDGAGAEDPGAVRRPRRRRCARRRRDRQKSRSCRRPDRRRGPEVGNVGDVEMRSPASKARPFGSASPACAAGRRRRHRLPRRCRPAS